ncbi:MAG TPA: flagellar hook-basal body complex protein FliE [Gemmataceae bacterium]|nr:flagellar hook-basal body complex protein FliE [Gemmataceae bacterium]
MAIAPLGPVSWAPSGPAVGEAAQTAPGGQPFTSVIKNLLADANSQQVQADQAIQGLASGHADSLHQVMLSVAKADLSFRMVLEIRNRLTEAYQEIMRMQV